jgi:hypothetical protein
MDFEDVVAYGAIAGIVLIVVGAVVLAVLPNWRGVSARRGEEAPQAAPGAAERIVGALVEALSGFLKIVTSMLTGKAGRYHPGQVLVAIGFLLLLVCGLLWLVTQL